MRFSVLIIIYVSLDSKDFVETKFIAKLRFLDEKIN